MELLIHLTTLPQGMSLRQVEEGLDQVLEDDGWLTASAHEAGAGRIEIELEDERMNPKYGILAVKSYLQRMGFPKETMIELAGKPVGIYE